MPYSTFPSLNKISKSLHLMKICYNIYMNIKTIQAKLMEVHQKKVCMEILQKKVSQNYRKT